MKKGNLKIKNLLVTLVAICFLGLILQGCSKAGEKDAPEAGKGAEPPKKVELKYAKGFSIELIQDNCKLVTDAESNKYLLVPKGGKAPEGYENIPVVNIPVSRTICFSTAEVPYISQLGGVQAIKGVTAEKSSWYIEELVKSFDSGNTVFIGKKQTPDYELLKGINPEMVFLPGKPEDLEKQKAKLKELGFSYSAMENHLENDPLGRLEWIKYYGAFFDKMDEAESYFNQVEKNLKDMEKAMAGLKKPKVAYAFILKGTAYVPSAGSYYKRMVDIAGGDYIFNDLGLDDGGFSKITPEEFYVRAKDADILIYDNTSDVSTKSIEDLLKASPVLKDAKFVTSGNVWGVDRKIWQNNNKIDQIIKDMSSIIQPEQYKGHEKTYYYKLK